MNHTRRAALGSFAALGTAGLAGCLGGVRPTGGTGTDAADANDETAAGAPPTADEPRRLAYDRDALVDESLDGGVGKDGIPSVDDPAFEPVVESDLVDDAPVFGVVRDGEAKAYPQRVLAHHEIVNDVVGGDPIAVTYCPLTGTAQGFERGETTFGVSGRLVNSNLIMYDRATESWWPQVLATAVEGPMRGATLREFRVVWTTVAEWRSARPDAVLMTDDTGYVRRYGNDPYGIYAPLDGYYAAERTIFPPLSEPETGHPKSVVLGARTAGGAVAFDKRTLLDRRVLTGTFESDGDPAVAVADATLSTGYVYRTSADATVEPDGDGYLLTGRGAGPEGPFEPTELPLERVLALDAMWFAWAGFYPDTGFAGEHTGAGYGR